PCLYRGQGAEQAGIRADLLRRLFLVGDVRRGGLLSPPAGSLGTEPGTRGTQTRDQGLPGRPAPAEAAARFSPSIRNRLAGSRARRLGHGSANDAGVPKLERR